MMKCSWIMWKNRAGICKFRNRTDINCKRGWRCIIKLLKWANSNLSSKKLINHWAWNLLRKGKGKSRHSKMDTYLIINRQLLELNKDHQIKLVKINHRSHQYPRRINKLFLKTIIFYSRWKRTRQCWRKSRTYWKLLINCWKVPT